MQTPDQLLEHFFRHEYGRLVSLLTRKLGVRRIELVEDVVQSALLRALQSWSKQGLPDDPAGWLYSVARNAALDALRREKNWSAVAQELPTGVNRKISGGVSCDNEIADDQLRLLFVCCHPALPPESHVPMALKTLCGFGVEEIARALLIGGEAIQKRLGRAKEKLRQEHFDAEDLTETQIAERLPSVQTIVYLLFNEGYSSVLPDQLIRMDVCQEAIRLGLLLATHPLAGTPATQALLALMLLHAARFEARLNHSGELQLLEEQDRQKWDWALVREGMAWLSRAARGETVTSYHLEAAIAAEHCLPPSLAETNWKYVVALYDRLCQLSPNSVHQLNRAIAIAYWHGPQAGLTALHQAARTSGWSKYHYWYAALGELHRRLGECERARDYFEKSLELAAAPAERELLRKRLLSCAKHGHG